jgi:hypothetical protein
MPSSSLEALPMATTFGAEPSLLDQQSFKKPFDSRVKADRSLEHVTASKFSLNPASFRGHFCATKIKNSSAKMYSSPPEPEDQCGPKA